MKKFNANGGFRKDAKKEYDEHDLNNYSGKSLKEATEALDDTILLSAEQIEDISNRLMGNMEENPQKEDTEIQR